MLPSMLRESRTIIDTLLDTLPNTVAANTTVESGMGPALQVRGYPRKSVGSREGGGRVAVQLRLETVESGMDPALQVCGKA